MATFWDKVKGVGNAAVAAASDAKKAASEAITELRSVPSQVMCPNTECQTIIPVPAALWNWNCPSVACGKINDGKVNACESCKTTKPKLPNPRVTCPKCQREIVVPSSGAGRILDDAQTVLIATGSTIKKEYHNLQEKPTQFHCEHCQTLLGVPAPMPWNCTSCKAANRADSAACAGCGGTRGASANMVMCGVCNKPTKVPANNLIVQMKHGVTSAERQIKKLYLDVRNKPYIMCPRCTTPLHVDIKAAQAAQAATQASANKNKDAKDSASASTTSGPMGGQPAADNKADAKMEAVSGANQIEGRSSAVPPAAAAAAAEEPGAGIEVVCTKCSERLLVAVDAAPVPAPAATPAPTPAAVAPATEAAK